MKQQTERKNPNRVQKVNALIQQVAGEAIHELLAEQPGLVTISRVEASRDLRWAKVWISIVGGDDDKILDLLQKNLYDIQGAVNRSMARKIVPRLQLFLDTAPRYAQHIDELINKMHEENEK